MEVTYTTTKADLWRCNLYMWTHSPLRIAALLIPPFTLMTLVYSTFYYPHVQRLPWNEALSIFLIISGGFCALYVRLMASAIASILRSRSALTALRPTCTTSISTDGIRDVTPEQDQTLAWNDVTAVCYHHGDLYYRKSPGNIFVPRGAFRDTEEANQFYLASLDFWQRQPSSATLSKIVKFTNKQDLDGVTSVVQSGKPDDAYEIDSEDLGREQPKNSATQVTYRVGRAGRWRWDLYTSKHRFFHTYGLLLLPFIPMALGAYIFRNVPPSSTHGAVILLCLPGLMWYMLAVGGKRTRTVTVRPGPNDLCTTSITDDGIRDVSPLQDQLLAWKDVKAVRFYEGDVYFWKASGEIMVPRGAFDSPEAARQFYESALGFWSNQTTATKPKFVRDTSVTSFVHDTGLTGKLEAGETVLWQGQPDPVAYAKAMPYFQVKVLVGLVLLITSVCASVPFSVIWSFPLFFWFCALMMYFVQRSAYRETSQKQKFMITDKRIITSDQKGILPPTFETLDLAQIEIVKYWEPSNGKGTVEFGAASNASATLSSVPDVATVVRLVAQARSQQLQDTEALFTSRQQSDPFLGALHPGETILWQGQPERRQYLNAFWGMWGGIVFYPLIAWIILLTALDFSQTQALWKQLAEVAPFALLSTWLIGRRYQDRAKSSTALFYAVTNERLLLLDRSKPQFFAEADLAAIQKMKYEESSRGTGTISFGGKYNSDIDFEFLTNPSDVRGIITEAKQKISGEAMDWVDVAIERAKKPKPLFRSRWVLAMTILAVLYFPVQLAVLSYYKHHYFYPGMRHYNRGEYAAAAHDFRIATNATMSERAPYYLGLALMHEGKNQEAIQAFDQAYDRALAGRYPDYEMEKQAQTMIDQINAAQAHASSPTHQH